jgi:Zn-dependent protease with chaperone function
MTSMVESLQQTVDDLLRELGIQRHGVKVRIVKKKSVVAGAWGLNISNCPFGEVLINARIANPQNPPHMSKDELDFILAHEVVHIFYNHPPVSVLAKLPRTLLDALAAQDEEAVWLKLLVEFVNVMPAIFGKLPLEASLTKDQELQADVLAICLTRNRSAALEALKKLVNYNLDQPSHQWEMLGAKLPVTTMRERLSEIQRRTQEYEIRYGYVFR